MRPFWNFEASLRLIAPRTLDDAKVQLCRLASEVGFDNVSYVGGRAFNPRGGGHAVWTRPPVVINTFPVEFLSLYHRQDLSRVDPIVHETLRHRLPFSWDAEGLSKITPPEKDFLFLAHDFKIVRGLTVPVYGPAGDFALFSFVSSANSTAFNKMIRRHGHMLHLAAIYSHQLLSTFAERQRPDTRLTPREIEVLQWTALGKTMGEIGEIIGLSDKTIQYHMYNAMKKLGVYSKAAATAKAVVLGLIQP
jgi:DNA-binding CsgD family transcriptional regulator